MKGSQKDYEGSKREPGAREHRLRRERERTSEPLPSGVLALDLDEGLQAAVVAAALHLDCSPLERALAPRYVPSRQGRVPFHPVSLFLCICLRPSTGSG